MNFKENHFNMAQQELERRRTENLSRQLRRQEEIGKALPEYEMLEKKLAQTAGKLVSIIAENGPERDKELKELQDANLGIQRTMAQVLGTAGYPADYLDKIYTCPKCKDTGTVDGRWCDCFNQLLLKYAADDLNAVSPLKLSGFDSFSLNHYSVEPEGVGKPSARTIMTRNLDYCRQYAESFTMNSESILMTGGTGLGKTHLSLAIANAVIAKGHNVIYCSAPEIFRTLEREYYGRSDEDTMQTLTTCDLLILDDLGAELEKSTYTSLLYELLNCRIGCGLPTIANTNLGKSEFSSRYNERICSRLMSYKTLFFIGQDVRIKLKKNK